MRTPLPTSVVAAVAVALFALSLAVSLTSAQATPRKAPAWDIAEWINGPGPNLDELRGQVVVIDFFQMWCPGCKRFSIPLMEHWEKTVFTDEVARGRLVFLSIHTVFEGHAYQTPARLRRFIREKGITHPVGIDRHAPGERVPETMARYNTMGTPEMAIIGKTGRIRFQRFGVFDPAEGERLIRTLLEEPTEAEPAAWRTPVNRKRN